VTQRATPAGPAADRMLARRYLRLLTETCRGGAALTMSLTLAGIAAEGLGLLLLVPLLAVAGVDAGSAGAASSAGAAILGTLHVPRTLGAVLAAYIAVVGARVVLARWTTISTVQLQERLVHLLRLRLYRAMLGARWDQLSSRRTPELTRVLTGELNDFSDVPAELLALFGGATLTAVYLVIAARLSLPTTAVALACGAVLLLLLRPRRRLVRETSRAVDEEANRLFATASEYVGAVKTTKSYGAEHRSERLFEAGSASFAAAMRACWRHSADTRAIFGLGSTLLLGASVYVALAVLRVGAAELLVLLYLLTRLTPRLAGLESTYQRIMLAMPAFERTMRVLDHCERAVEGAGESAASLPAPRLRRSVALRGVSFRYAAAEPGVLGEAPGRESRAEALTNVTLAIPAGELTAIVGPSGGGKSTIADLVLGFQFADTGRLEIDGEELTPARARAWRARTGYVAQETFLFHDTIRGNLLWAQPDATEAELREALALAAADEFVARLPEGLDTMIGDRGARLSGGERQRLALARALLRRPDLLVLDEATSAVDVETERRIQHAVEALRGRTTVLWITHRLSTVRDADRIHVIERGRVVESGRWDELLARDGRLAALCRTPAESPRLALASAAGD